MPRIDFSRKIIFLLPIILITGFFLRVWGIGFGLPYQFHQDEPIVVNHALAYGMGNFNPGFFAIPPLVSYLLFFVYGVMFFVGSIFGSWHGSEEFAVKFFQDPSIFYLAGRFFLGVIPGTVAIFLTYRLSSRFISEKAALYAAAIMAFCFLNVINSHYIYTDMVLTVVILFAYERMYAIFKSPTIWNYFVAGFFVGLAAGVKYNGIILFVPYLWVHLSFAGGADRKWLLLSGKFWCGIFSALAAFIIVNPFALLDWQGFLTSFIAQSGAFSPTGWFHHIKYSLFEGISFPLTVLGFIGIMFFLFDRNKWHKAVVFFPIALYLVLVFKSQHFSRYVLFLVPFFAMGAGYILFDKLSAAAIRFWSGRIVVCIAVMLIVPTFLKSVKADILFSSPDTRVTAAHWMRENLTEGTKIACDSTIFRPAVKQPYSQLVDKKGYVLGQEDVEGSVVRKLDYMIKTADPDKKGYPLYFLYENPEVQGKFLNTLPAIPYDLDKLAELNIKYICVNGQSSSPSTGAFIESLGLRGEVVAEFSPYKDGKFRMTGDKIALTCMSVTDEEVFSRVVPGPSLRIYKVLVENEK